MRPLLAIVLTTGILGGLQAFLSFRKTDGPYVGAQLIQATGEYALELTLSFDAGPDPFGLDAEDTPSVLVSLAGQELLRRTDTISASQPLLIPSVAGLVVGRNEIFVQASSADTSSLRPRALRLRVLRDGTSLAEQSLWANSGEPVQGTIIAEVPE